MPDIEPTFNVEKYRWFKSQRELDILALDDELMHIPAMVQECAEITAIAIELSDRAKEELDRTKAIVCDRIRRNEVPAPSEQKITSLFSKEEDYQAAVALLAETRLDAGLWKSMLEAFRTKSSGMRVTADLINSGWLTTSHVLDKRRRELRQGPKQ